MPAAGPISLPQEYLRQSLAATATWQGLCGVASAAGALGRIYHDGLPMPEDGQTHQAAELAALRPCAIVYTEDDGLTYELEAGGEELCYGAKGRLVLELMRNAPAEALDEPCGPAARAWRELLEDLVEELGELSGLAGYLACQTITIDEVHQSHPDGAETEGAWQGARVTVEW